jgi:CubicO group peptidase (beta-lactamase class C family)
MKACLLVLMLSFAAAALAQTPDGFDRAWQTVRDDYVQANRTAGVVGSSLVVLHAGQPLAAAYFGLADRATQRAVEARTIYHWASITKTFTAIALMQLRDRGLVSLDDPIVDYLPELRAVHNPYGDMRMITLRQLMSHSAGFRAATWPWGGEEPWHPHEPTTWAQLAAMMPYTEILFEPDTQFRYSNPGIIFLGRVIEILTGDDYEVYIDKNILKPLGMYESYFDHTPYHLLPYRSNNYYVEQGQAHPNGLDFDTGITVSNGGLNAPLTDMAKYLAFLMGSDDPAVQARYEAILRRTSLEEMWQPRFPVAEREGGFRESMGLSFFLLEKDGFRVIGHTGSQKAFQSFIYFDPASRTGAIAAWNTVGLAPEGQRPQPDTPALLNALRLALFEHLFPLFRPVR